jgi:hypothetical protein
MDMQCGPRMAFARRRCLGLCTLALVLRFSFSEDCASEVRSEHWCGAAKRTMTRCAAKYAFLFQFCTRPPPARFRAEGIFLVQVIDRIGIARVRQVAARRESTAGR